MKTILILIVLAACCTANVNDGAKALANNKLVNKKNQKRAADLGKKVREQMQKFRGGNDEFYRNLLEALTILQCNQQTVGPDDPNVLNPSLRFVPADDPAAYKNSTGGCIKVSKPNTETQRAYSMNKCEVAPNCYWREVDSNDPERLPVYSTMETPEAPHDATTLPEAENRLVQWAEGLVVFVAPGIVLSVLSLLTMLLFVLCRCCCNKCGGRNPKPEGYSCTQKFVPFLFFAIFSAGIAATAGLTLLYNKGVTEAVTGVFQVSQDVVTDAQDWIVEARDPLINIRDDITGSVENIQTQFEGTDFIETGVDGLTEKLNEFGSSTANVKLPNGCTDAPGEICIACEACTTISDSVSESNTQMNTAASDGIEEFQNIREVLDKELVSISSSIQVNVDEKVSTTEILLDGLRRTHDSVTQVRSVWDGQDKVRSVGALAMFALAIVVIALGTVGIIFKVTPLRFLGIILHLAYMIGFIALFVGFILAAVFMAISVLLSDSCEVTRILSEDWTPAMGPGAAKGLNACFQNESLLEAFNLTGSFEFADAVEFPQVDLSSMLDFSEFDTFAREINNTNASTFDVSGIETYIDALNDATGVNVAGCNPNDDSYTKNNVESPWEANSEADPSTSAEVYIRARYSDPSTTSNCDAIVPLQCHRGQDPCTYEEFVYEIYSNITTLLQVERDSVTFVTDMKTSMAGVSSYIGEFKSNMTNFNDRVTVIKDDLTSSLIKNVDDFKGAMYCTFIGDQFEVFYEHLCVDLLPALLMIALMVFLMGMFLIPVNICIIILSKRLGTKRDQNVVFTQKV